MSKVDHDQEANEILRRAAAPVAVQPPRQPTPSIRRDILARVEATFDETRGVYLEGASDEAIAKERDIPRAWVSAIREEFFGPIRSCPELDAIRADIATAKTDAVSMFDRALSVAGDVEKLVDRINGLTARVDALGKK